MSRIAKQPVPIPTGTEWKVEGDTLHVKGPQGELSSHIPAAQVNLKQDGETVQVSGRTEESINRAAAGLVRNLLANLVQGAQEPHRKELVFSGVGYRAAVEGDAVTLSMGYSHPVKLSIPAGLSAAVQKNRITVSGPDLQAVGQFAANIRAVRPPEPYKGKGIAYADERIRRKAGKAGKAAG